MPSKKFANEPFFNFLRSYCNRHTKWPATRIAVEGAKLWHAMCPHDKEKFVQQAEMARKMQEKGGSSSVLKKNRGSRGKSMCYGSGRRGRRSRPRKSSKSRRRRSRSRRSRSRGKH